MNASKPSVSQFVIAAIVAAPCRSVVNDSH
jgi:hypothetical protein